MMLVIDNYDSFTYNLVQYLGELGAEMLVIRNDEMTVDEIEADVKPERLLISPGPGTPDGAGISLAAIERFAGRIPILGVCLGHQAIGQAYGGRVVRAPVLMHGKVSTVHHDGRSVFRGIDGDFKATRYHSLMVAPETVPDPLSVTAWADSGVVMGLMHKRHPVHGVQFHPESIASEHGHRVLKNFIDIAAEWSVTNRAQPALA
jgi:anthranilate synthase component 2